MKSMKFIDHKSAFSGFLLTLPFVILNTIAVNEIEPFFTFFKIPLPGGFWMNPIGFLALIFSLLLLPIAGVIIAQPLFRKGADGKREFYLINFILAASIFIFFAIFLGAWIRGIP